MSGLGVRLSDFGKVSLPETLFKRAIDHGYSNGQLVLFKNFEGLNSYSEAIPESLVRSIYQSLLKTNFQISVLGCYQNLVDRSLHNEIIENFKKYCAVAKTLNATCIGTESSFDLKDHYEDEDIDYVVELSCKLIDIAYENEVKLGLEFCFYHPFKDLALLKRILTQCKHKESVVLIFDPVNILSNDSLDVAKQTAVLEPWIKEYGAMIKVIHAKNFILQSGKRVKTPLKDGFVDFANIKKLLNKYQVTADFVVREEPFLDDFLIERRDLETLASL